MNQLKNKNQPVVGTKVSSASHRQQQSLNPNEFMVVKGNLGGNPAKNHSFEGIR